MRVLSSHRKSLPGRASPSSHPAGISASNRRSHGAARASDATSVGFAQDVARDRQRLEKPRLGAAPRVWPRAPKAPRRTFRQRASQLAVRRVRAHPKLATQLPPVGSRPRRQRHELRPLLNHRPLLQWLRMGPTASPAMCPICPRSAHPGRRGRLMRRGGGRDSSPPAQNDTPGQDPHPFGNLGAGSVPLSLDG